MSINIKGINRDELLRSLWNRSTPSHFFDLTQSPDFDIEKSKKETHKNGYIDYCCGRLIKVNLSHDIIDPYEYDQHNGNGAFQSVVDGIKEYINMKNKYLMEIELNNDISMDNLIKAISNGVIII